MAVINGIQTNIYSIRTIQDVTAGDDLFVGDDATIADTLTLTTGGPVTSPGGVHIVITPGAAAYTAIGTAGHTEFGAPTNNEFYVEGKQEVKGTAYFKSNINARAGISMSSNAMIGELSGNIGVISTSNVDQEPDMPMLLTGTRSNAWALCEYANRSTDYGHAQQTNPTWFIHSTTAAGTATDEWVSDTHNVTDAVRGIGSGGHVTNHGAPTSLADDASFDLPAASAGFGFLIVGDAEEYAHFAWNTDEDVTLIVNSGNVVATDTDAKFCIFDNTTTVRIRNRLGATKTVTFDYHYTTSP